MPRRRTLPKIAPSLAAFAVMLLAVRASAQQETLLQVLSPAEGITPYSTLIFDSSGNLYGTAASAGAHGFGTAFELTPSADGGWTETVLHSFSGGSSDGAAPDAGLALDPSGNLYGTTCDGGAYGFGTVFELKRTATGFAEAILHNFANTTADGGCPSSSVIFDAKGNIYGETPSGGAYNGGVVYELIRRTGGNWTEEILYSLPNPEDLPYRNSQRLVFDPKGNL